MLSLEVFTVISSLWNVDVSGSRHVYGGQPDVVAYVRLGPRLACCMWWLQVGSLCRSIVHGPGTCG